MNQITRLRFRTTTAAALRAWSSLFCYGFPDELGVAASLGAFGLVQVFCSMLTDAFCQSRVFTESATNAAAKTGNATKMAELTAMANTNRKLVSASRSATRIAWDRRRSVPGL